MINHYSSTQNVSKDTAIQTEEISEKDLTIQKLLDVVLNLKGIPRPTSKRERDILLNQAIANQLLDNHYGILMNEQ